MINPLSRLQRIWPLSRIHQFVRLCTSFVVATQALPKNKGLDAFRKLRYDLGGSDTCAPDTMSKVIFWELGSSLFWSRGLAYKQDYSCCLDNIHVLNRNMGHFSQLFSGLLRIVRLESASFSHPHITLSRKHAMLAQGMCWGRGAGGEEALAPLPHPSATPTFGQLKVFFFVLSQWTLDFLYERIHSKQQNAKKTLALLHFNLQSSQSLAASKRNYFNERRAP